MPKRINVMLPEETLRVLDRVTSKGNRSQFISRAVLNYVETRGKQTLRERLKEEALARAQRDVEMAADWFPLEEEALELASRTPRKRKARKPRRR